MRVLLIYPADKKFKEYNAMRPPLGIAYIAANLEKHGHHVKIIDLALEPLSEVTDNINSYDMVGISVLTAFYIPTKKLIEEIRKINSKIPIILGGPHVSGIPELVLKENDINIVVRGEGDLIMVELASALEKKHSFKKIKGISYKKGNRIYHNPDGELIKNLDELPWPARHLLNIKKYKNYLKDRIATTIISSRGCPYNCIYCPKLGGPNWRGRSSKSVVDEIKTVIENYNIIAFYFHDDLFTFNKERVVELCKEIINQKLNIIWRCEARVDTIDEEILYWMKKSGCYNIEIGVESGDSEILQKIKKNITLEQVRKAFQLTKKFGIYTRAYFMIGFPWDTKETIMRTVKFANEIACDEVVFAVIMPMPGTELWNYAIKNKIIDENTVDWNDFYPTSLNFKDKIFFTQNLSAKEIIDLRKKAYKSVIISKLLKKIKEGDLKYIYEIMKEKSNIGLGRFFKNLFLFNEK